MAIVVPNLKEGLETGYHITVKNPSVLVARILEVLLNTFPLLLQTGANWEYLCTYSIWGDEKEHILSKNQQEYKYLLYYFILKEQIIAFLSLCPHVSS